MPNYQRHIKGGLIAFGITLVSIATVSYYSGHLPQSLHNAKNSIFFQFPAILAGIEYSLKAYLPSFIKAVDSVLSMCFPWALTIGEWVLFSLAGALFPDIDIKSTSQKYLYIALLIITLIFIGKQDFKAVAFMSVASLLPIFSKHRGLFHRFWFVLLVPFALWVWVSLLFPHVSHSLFYCMLFFMAGALSHLWLDMGFFKMFRF